MIAENEPQDDGSEDVKLLTARALAQCLSVSVRQCWRLNKKKLLPAPVCVGERIIRWNAAEVADWLRAGSPPRSEWEQLRATQTVGNESA